MRLSAILLWLCCTGSLLGQSLSGKIILSDGKLPAHGVICLTPDKAQQSVIYGVIHRDTYLLRLSGQVGSCKLTVNIPGYFLIIKEMDTISGNTFLDVYLQKDSVVPLKEILIRSPRKAWKKRQDTAFFQLDAYRDGSEKTVEDMLRKLPGIHVDDRSGMITYKGNTVQAVKLDGHDLLGKHYTAGTRNIAADLIQEVQAIEQDPDHPLLKNLEPTGKTVLNLSLKKNLVRLNGQANLSLGARADQQLAAEAQTSLLGLSGKIQSFSTAGFNNRGNSNGISGSEFNESTTNDSEASESFTMRTLLTPPFMPLPLPDPAYRFNEEKNINLNILVPAGRKQLWRGNLHWHHDRLAQSSHQQGWLLSNDAPLTVSDRMNTTHLPLQLLGSIYWQYQIRPTTLISYRGNSDLQESHSQWQQELNKVQTMESDLIHRNFQHHHQLEWLTRVNEKIAFRSKLIVSDGRQTQCLHIQHANLAADSLQVQRVAIQKQGLWLQHAIHGKWGGGIYRIEAGIHWQKSALETEWQQRVFVTAFDSIFRNNQVESRQQSIYLQAEASLTCGSFLLKPSLRLSAFQWRLEQAAKNYIERNWIPFEPQLMVVQKITSSLNWVTRLALSFLPPETEQTFLQPVQTAPRYRHQYASQPERQRVWMGNTMLVLNDFFRQLNAEVGLRYIGHQGIMIPMQELTPLFIHTTYRFAPLVQSAWQGNANAEKFLPMLMTTIKTRLSVQQTEYFNQLNPVSLRRNRSIHQEAECAAQARFGKRWSASAALKITYISIYTGDRQVQENQMVFQSLKCLWRPVKTMQGILSAAYHQPQWGKGTGIWLVDASFRYQPKGKKWHFSISGKNLLDQRHFRETELSDYAILQRVTPLLPALWTAELQWRF